MPGHPVKASLTTFSLSILLALLAIACYYGLLWFYEGTPWIEALVESVLVICIWYVVFYYSWYLVNFIPVFQAWVVITVVLEVFSLSVCYLFLSLFGINIWLHLPLIAIMSLLVWFILSQFYITASRKEEESDQAVRELAIVHSEVTEKLDKISVKDGSRIHIIPVYELQHIQASGDYVTLFSGDKQFVKELTMKYLETHLPVNFVRIHRSCIVNTDYILRIELFGKENYHVRLKNGESLKASLTGYKMLKERLKL